MDTPSTGKLRQNITAGKGASMDNKQRHEHSDIELGCGHYQQQSVKACSITIFEKSLYQR